jgi:ABC-type antimicrobial peptide transport system permease subunit
VLREGAALAVIGVVVGLIAAFGATSVIQSWLFGIERSDPWTLVGTAATLVTIALAASYLPALRATRVDPLLAMRAE